MKKVPLSYGIWKILLVDQVCNNVFINVKFCSLKNKRSFFSFSAVMEPFLKSYYDHFKYQSIDSFQFKDYFLDYFKDKDLSAIEWDKWFNQPGMPIYKPKFDESLAKVK